MPPKRRSMGTKSNMMSAMRVSMDKAGAGQPGAQMDSARRGPTSSVKKGSKLPRFEAARPSRLSSIGRAGSQNNLFQTPSNNTGRRSQSGSRPSSVRMSKTPQRVLQPHNANRMSMGSNRGSVIGTKVYKDSRCLGDKLWQKQAVQEIIGFCSANSYPKQLVPGDFPVSSTEFRNLFEFLFGYLVEGYELPKKQIEMELPGLLKKIGYTITVSKSCFQTLGTQHSWPAVLGVLHFIMKRAEEMAQITDGDALKKEIFPCKDEHGFDMARRSDDAIIWDHQLLCYNDFNKGRDDNIAEQQHRVEMEFRQNYQPADLDRLDRDLKQSRKKLDSLQREPNTVEHVVQERDIKVEDVEKLKQYQVGLNDYKTKLEKELKDSRASVREKEGKVSGLHTSIEHLKVKCKDSDIPEDNSTINIQTQHLRNQIDSKKDEISEVEKLVWNLELVIGKAEDELDNLKAKISTGIRKLDLGDETRAWMDRLDSPADLFQLLQNLRLEKESQARDAELGLDQMKTELTKKINELRTKKDLLARLEKEHTDQVILLERRKQEIAEDDEKLTQHISSMKNKISDIKNGSGVNLRSLQETFDKATLEKADRERKLEEEGLKLNDEIKKSKKSARTYLEEKERQKVEMYKSFEELAKAVIDDKNAFADRMEGHLKTIDKLELKKAKK